MSYPLEPGDGWPAALADAANMPCAATSAEMGNTTRAVSDRRRTGHPLITRCVQIDGPAHTSGANYQLKLDGPSYASAVGCARETRGDDTSTLWSDRLGGERNCSCHRHRAARLACERTGPRGEHRRHSPTRARGGLELRVRPIDRSLRRRLLLCDRPGSAGPRRCTQAHRRVRISIRARGVWLARGARESARPGVRARSTPLRSEEHTSE